jgi:hypothetical protein
LAGQFLPQFLQGQLEELPEAHLEWQGKPVITEEIRAKSIEVIEDLRTILGGPGNSR